MDILFQVTHCIEFTLLINLAHAGQRHEAHLWLCHHFPCIHFLCIYWMLGFLILLLITPDSIMQLSLPMRLTTPIMFFLSVGSCSLCSLVKIDLLYTEMSSFIHGVAYVWTSFFSLNNIPCVHIQHLDCLHVYWWTPRSWAAERLKECYREYQ